MKIVRHVVVDKIRKNFMTFFLHLFYVFIHTPQKYVFVSSLRATYTYVGRYIFMAHDNSTAYPEFQFPEAGKYNPTAHHVHKNTEFSQ